MLEDLWRDVLYGVRVLRKSPVFTCVAMASLAIGIGANTALFSMVDTVLLRTLPVRHPEELVVFGWGAKESPPDVSSSYSNSSGGGRLWPVAHQCVFVAYVSERPPQRRAGGSDRVFADAQTHPDRER